MKTVLFVTHPASQCGVYQYGYNTAMVLKESAMFNFIHVECTRPADLQAHILQHSPRVIVYNYHVGVLGWATDGLLQQYPHIKSAFIQHEYHQPVPASASLVISQDPTDEETERVVPVPRVLHDYARPVPINSVLTIGTFGFGLADKGFDRLVSVVCEEFDDAVVRLHIPFAKFGDGDGRQARGWADLARSKATKPSVQVVVDHDWFSKDQLLEFLAGNDLNAFFHGPHPNRGNSGTLDFALSVPRPLAITQSSMFKHVWTQVPEITIEKNSLRSILDLGLTPLAELKRQWSRKNLRTKYENIVSSLLSEETAHV